MNVSLGSGDIGRVIGELIAAWLLADLVTTFQVVVSAVTQGSWGVLVSLVTIWIWGLIPFPFSLIANIIEPSWAFVEVVSFAIFAFLMFRSTGGGSMGINDMS